MIVENFRIDRSQGGPGFASAAAGIGPVRDIGSVPRCVLAANAPAVHFRSRIPEKNGRPCVPLEGKLRVWLPGPVGQAGRTSGPLGRRISVSVERRRGVSPRKSCPLSSGPAARQFTQPSPSDWVICPTRGGCVVFPVCLNDFRSLATALTQQSCRGRGGRSRAAAAAARHRRRRSSNAIRLP